MSTSPDDRDDAADPPGPDAALLSLIGTGEELLRASIEVLGGLVAEIREGEVPSARAFSAIHTELAKTLRLGVEIQRSYDDWRERTSGAPAPGDIDFDRVRNTLRGKLDRLRSETGAGEVS